MTLRACSGCGRTFDHHRKREDVCPDCRSALAASSLHAAHRLDVVRLKAGRAAVAGVLAALEDEGFVVAPPGTAVVPGDWLVLLRRMLRPEDLGEGPLPFTVGGYQALANHIDNLPAIERITATTGETPS